jgi:hypothetical protein
MYIDSLAHLSSAIDAAFEAAMVPGLVLVGVALVIMAGRKSGIMCANAGGEPPGGPERLGRLV